MRKEGPDSLGLSKILEQISGGPRIPTLTFRHQNPEYTAFSTRQAIDLDFLKYMQIF